MTAPLQAASTEAFKGFVETLRRKAAERGVTVDVASDPREG